MHIAIFFLYVAFIVDFLGYCKTCIIVQKILSFHLWIIRSLMLDFRVKIDYHHNCPLGHSVCPLSLSREYSLILYKIDLLLV